MKKNFLLISALALSLCAGAQEKVIRSNKIGDNWFLQLQGGGSMTITEGFKDASFGDVISPYVAVSVGKYFNPQVGARLQVGGWMSRNSISDDVKNGRDSRFKAKYIQTNADALFNLTNIFLEYNRDRIFNVYGIAGLGYVHGFKDTKNGLSTTNSIAPRAGFMFDFKVNDAVNLNLEATGNLMNDDFNGIKQGTKYDGTVNVLAGIIFKFGKNYWDVVDYIDPSQVNDLNQKINAQRSELSNKDAQISQLRSQLDERPKVVVQKETQEVAFEETVMNAVVVFKIGKSDLQENQEINIYNAAKYFQDHPDVNIVVTGYADKATGNPTLNQKLSERRAEAVTKILIEKYGISPSRITKQASGDKQQPFQIDAWNRVVIFTAVPKNK